jgi:internalin A
MSSLPLWADIRLREAKAKRVPYVDLNPRRATKSELPEDARDPLTDFPFQLLEMPWLTSIDLEANLLSSVPSEIWQLEKLERLLLAGNILEAAPSGIAFLEKLRVLNLSGNHLCELPDTYADLTRLVSLHISANPLAEIPNWIGGLPHLKQLSIGAGERALLLELPEWLQAHHELEELVVFGHALTTLPKWIAHYPRLEVLRIGNNAFEEVPDAVFNAERLRILDLSNSEGVHTGHIFLPFESRNRIKHVPADLLRLRHLRVLNLHGNPLETPPPELITEDGETTVLELRRYFTQLQREGKENLNEAKLLIVGEPGAGKTTLSRKLIDRSYQLRDEESTQGIAIRLWRTEGTRQVRVNVWDFGGQEIYHATHQFFLTKRSVYAMVADSRQEDTDFYYWLNLIELLSDASPVILVLNEKQDRHRDLDVRGIRSQFPSLRAVVSVNFENNRGFGELVDRLTAELNALPHIGTELPRSWVNVRLAVETDHREWITIQEFDSLCDAHGFASVEEKRQLGGFLHDLGVCLHYQSDPLLRRIVILKPEWGTAAAYSVLDDARVRAAGGRFAGSDLERIWADPKFDQMRDELLRLMLNFRLCYELAEPKDTYIAPQLLPTSRPDHEFPHAESLQVDFVYEFMPKGIASQLIVHLHDLIEDPALAWRSGVVLSREKAIAEVTESHRRRRITVQVAGRGKLELFGIISRALDSIHSSYPQISVQALIPCSCEHCRTSDSMEHYALATLQQFAQDRQDWIQCRRSYQQVSVRSLLAEVTALAPEPASLVSGPQIWVQGNVKTLVVGGSGDLLVPLTRVMDVEGEEIEMQTPKNNAWSNGSFCLIAFVVVIATIGTLARLIPILALPLVLIGAVILLPIVGALQLRNDDRLKEKTFIELMGLFARQLPLLRGSERPNHEEQRPEGPETPTALPNEKD